MQENVAVSQFPDILMYRTTDLRDQAVDTPALYTKLLVRLEHLQNLFFIERLMHRETHSISPELIDISYEMVSLTLVYWTHRDRLAGLYSDFEWICMQYAAPAGGVLCLGLLHPDLRVKRSDIVLQLSLLIGFFDWVRPSAPNSDLCTAVKNVIKRVLDQTLNSTVGIIDVQESFLDTGMDFSTDINDYFSFDLLDTFDWLRPEG